MSTGGPSRRCLLSMRVSVSHTAQKVSVLLNYQLLKAGSFILSRDRVDW
jgi:hypothetical protein